jgi:hypothetical protein
MPVQLVAPLYKTFELKKTDAAYGNDGDPTTVTIKQARQHEHASRQDMYKELKREWNAEDDPNKITLIQAIAMEEVHREEAWLTMVECNLLGPDGEPMFPSVKGKDDQPRLRMSKRDFQKAWGQLWPDIVEEIIDKIYEVNLLWDPQVETA